MFKLVNRDRKRPVLVCSGVAIFVTLVGQYDVGLTWFISNTYACFCERISIAIGRRVIRVFFQDRFFRLQCIIDRVRVRIGDRVLYFCRDKVRRRFRTLVNCRAYVCPLSSAPKDYYKCFRGLILYLTMVVDGVGSRTVIRRLRVRAHFMEDHSFELRLIIRLRVIFNQNRCAVVRFREMNVMWLVETYVLACLYNERAYLNGYRPT